MYSQSWKNQKIVLCQRSFSIPPATHRGEDGAGRSGWRSRGLLTVTGRAPPRDTLTGDPETRFSFNLCREMLAPGGETAGDGRSVNARRDPNRDIVGVSHSPGPRVGLYFRLYMGPGPGPWCRNVQSQRQPGVR